MAEDRTRKERSGAPTAPDEPAEGADATLSLSGAEDPTLAPGVDGVSSGPVTAEGVGERIGPYRLVEVLGDGGMGVVFLAEQTEPLQREVALKVIRAGYASRQLVARFESERRVLAMMDHPNIARVYDAGTTPAGSPYFVMELCRGKALNVYCIEHRLTLRARVELVLATCDAVQHAHQKGIIHRDLKPSNILVCPRGGDRGGAELKVIDFGIAKILDEPGVDEEGGDKTRAGQVLGTPIYMSPEQAGVGGRDVDTRSDVYSIGVILYELLTGTTPLKSSEVAQRPVGDLRSVITEARLERPSTRLEAAAGTLAGRAEQWSSDPGALIAEVRGDLDWIVMTAIEPERERRYPTVAALADDLRRHLADEPVSARPPSRVYLLKKFARRHRVGLAAGAALAASLIIGAAVSINQAVRAKEAEAAALEAGGRAQKAFASGEQLIGFVLEDLYFKLEATARIDLLEGVADGVSDYYEELPHAGRTRPGQLQHAEALRRVALVLRTRRRGDESAAELATAAEICRLLAEESPGDSRARRLGALIAHDRARLRLDAADVAGAEAYLGEAEHQIESLGATGGPETQRVRAQILSLRSEVSARRGDLNGAVGSAQAAAEAAQAAVDARRRQVASGSLDPGSVEPDLYLLAQLLEVLSAYRNSAGDRLGAAGEQSAADSVLGGLANPAQRRIRLLTDVIDAIEARAEWFRSHRHWDDAAEELAQLVDRTDELRRHDPDNGPWAHRRLRAYHHLADALAAAGDPSAEEAFQAALELAASPPEGLAAHLEWTLAEANLRRDYSRSLRENRNLPRAAEEAARAVELLRGPAAAQPGEPGLATALADASFDLAEARLGLDDPDSAAAALDGATAALSALVDQSPSVDAARHRLAEHHFESTRLWADYGYVVEAVLALTDLRAILGFDPPEALAPTVDAETRRRLGELALRAEEKHAAVDHFVRAFAAATAQVGRGEEAPQPAVAYQVGLVLESLANAFSAAARGGHPGALARTGDPRPGDETSSGATGPDASALIEALGRARVRFPPASERGVRQLLEGD